MEKSTVKILFYNENADSIVSSAGRISTTPGDAIALYEKSCGRDAAQNISLIHKILSSGHTSVLEHVFLNLAFRNVSVFVEQFMIEFRLASFTVKSRRYVDFGKMGYVTPAFERYGERAGEMAEVYQSHMDFLFEAYDRLLEKGIPKEDARFVLPYSFRSNFYCTVNARELVRIVNEMVWGRGSEYPELGQLGSSLIEQCEGRLPFLKFGGQRAKELPPLPEKKGAAVQVREEEGLAVLLHATDEPERRICEAALLGAGKRDWERQETEDPERQREIIKRILLRSRRRELEQANFSILFPRVSLAGVTHLVRHRMQSVVVPSYSEVCDFGSYILPESVVRAGLKEAYETAFSETRRVLERLKEEGMGGCDGVYFLLSGLTIPVMTTMNANELFTFIRLRTCSRAQWEIAECAKALLWVLREKYPVLFSLYGPACYVAGACPEGKLSCGQMEKVTSAFSMHTGA